jgi:hypothetical protein
MSTPNAHTILDFALLQSAAECYLDKIERPDDPAERMAKMAGNAQ